MKTRDFKKATLFRLKKYGGFLNYIVLIDSKYYQYIGSGNKKDKNRCWNRIFSNMNNWSDQIELTWNQFLIIDKAPIRETLQ